MRGARLRTAPIRTPASLARTAARPFARARPRQLLEVLDRRRLRRVRGGFSRQTSALTYYDAAKIKLCSTQLLKAQW